MAWSRHGGGCMGTKTQQSYVLCRRLQAANHRSRRSLAHYRMESNRHSESIYSVAVVLLKQVTCGIPSGMEDGQHRN